ncbi:hypothetical protein AYI68_g2060 [Smittium mucronatum]|uniref:Uncharacterized protein n=1 Tax=Smittium mucronatum TaxID=133383 RepID=A0A1R0H3N4_9FUNG|nr:hypothetical protein AYI68_g2060 [Smittium mucronatum]
MGDTTTRKNDDSSFLPKNEKSLLHSEEDRGDIVQFPKLRTSHTLPSSHNTVMEIGSSQKQSYSLVDVNDQLHLSLSAETIVTGRESSFRPGFRHFSDTSYIPVNKLTTPSRKSFEGACNNRSVLQNMATHPLETGINGNTTSHKKCKSFDHFASRSPPHYPTLSRHPSKSAKNLLVYNSEYSDPSSSLQMETSVETSNSFSDSKVVEPTLELPQSFPQDLATETKELLKSEYPISQKATSTPLVAEKATGEYDSSGLLFELDSIFDTIIKRSRDSISRTFPDFLPSKPSPTFLPTVPQKVLKIREKKLIPDAILKPIERESISLKKDDQKKSVNSFIKSFDFPVMEDLDLSMRKLPEINTDFSVEDKNEDEDKVESNRFSSIKFKFSQPPIPLDLHNSQKPLEYVAQKSPIITMEHKPSFDDEADDKIHLSKIEKRSFLHFFRLQHILSCFK